MSPFVGVNGFIRVVQRMIYLMSLMKGGKRKIVNAQASPSIMMKTIQHSNFVVIDPRFPQTKSVNCLFNERSISKLFAHKCVGRPAVALLVAICHVVNLLSTATRSKTRDARVIGTSLILGILNA